tara:strand:+ start:358 stop:591 length:234 start_codon:yes stop_codon:yes gene_type:complete
MRVRKKFNYEITKGYKSNISVRARNEKDAAHKLERFIKGKDVFGVVLCKEYEDDGFIEGTERLIGSEVILSEYLDDN